MEFCEGVGKGLAKFDTADDYANLRDITSGDVLDKAAWTALNNQGGQDCDGASACDGKLVKPYLGKTKGKPFLDHIRLYWCCV